MSEADGEFGAKLRTQRHSSGLSQEELAERSGLNVRTIRNLERGQARWPYPNTLHRLAEALGLADAARTEFMTAPGRRLPGPEPGGDEAPARDSAASVDTGPGVPRQLPAGIPHFTGRKAELDQLTAWLGEPGAPERAMVIAAISGAAGTGKSALAMHWAHQHAGLFPDGQLYADLRGFDPGSPVGAGTVLRRFLEALGVPPARLPTGPDAAAGLYRSVLAGRRMLIVLDNVRDAGQVRPLLPGTAGCMTLVTSRSQLTDLVALEGAVPLAVGPLTAAEATELLTRRLGAGRAAREQEAVAELIGLCDRLPLALNLAAARATANPAQPLTALTSRLRDTGRRLEVLSAGTGRADVRTVFSWSYRALSEPAARLFRLFGVHPGPDVSLPAAASLAALDLGETHRALAELGNANLITEQPGGRWTLSALLRAHAAGLPAPGGDPQERAAAQRRMLDHYVYTGSVAVGRYPNISSLPAPVLAPGVRREEVTSQAGATDWFTAEHEVLIAAATQAAGRFDRHTVQLIAALRPHLFSMQCWRDRIPAERLVLDAAVRLGDLTGQGEAHLYTGTAHRVLGDPVAAERCFRQASALFQQAGHPGGLAVTHVEFRALRRSQQREAEAAQHTRHALIQYRIAGDRAGEANVLNGIGWSHALQGNPAQGLPPLRQAFTLLRETSHTFNLASALDSLGYIYVRLGEHHRAIDCYQSAENIFSELGVPRLHAASLDRLGDAYQAAAATGAARRAWHRALDLYTGLGHQALDLYAGLGHQDIIKLQAKLAAR